MKKSDSSQYDDMIHLPHHVSPKRARMSLRDRAAQFSPFAALTGFDATIQETARLTDSRIELDESRKTMLNEKLQMIQEIIHTQPVVAITYFQPDQQKSGGEYITVTGAVKKVDPYDREIIFTDRKAIPIGDVYEISW